MAGHTACHRVNRIADVCAVLFKLILKLLYKCLSLSKCHAVARNDDDIFCSFEQGRKRVDRLFSLGNCFFFDRFRFPFRLVFCNGNRLFSFFNFFSARGSLSEQNVKQAAVHCPAHYLSEDKTGRADNTAHGNKKNVLDCKTCYCSRNAGKGVEKRNCNGHIRSADSN